MPDFNLKALFSGTIKKITGTTTGGKNALDVNVVDGTFGGTTPAKVILYDSEGNPVEAATSIDITPPTSISNGRKTITNAGTAEKLVASTTPCKYVIIKAIITNTGVAVVGGSGVVAAVGTRSGTSLSVLNGIPDQITIPIDDVSKIYVDSTVNGEGVIFTYVT